MEQCTCIPHFVSPVCKRIVTKLQVETFPYKTVAYKNIFTAMFIHFSSLRHKRCVANLVK